MGKSKYKNSKKSNSITKKRFFKNSLSLNKYNKSKIKTSIRNPIITSINEDSKFLYDINEFEIYFSKVKDKNRLKLNESELCFLKNAIINISNLKIHNNILGNIEIPFKIYNKINTYVPEINQKDEVVEYIKNLINEQKDKAFISCRRIANKYFCDTGKRISKTKVHNILRNKLNLKFRKTIIKTSKVNDNRNILSSICFIKIVIKCLKLDYKIIFIDESAILSNNNNFKTWRSEKEEIFYNIIPSKKKNLIAAVDDSQIIYYEITDENTTESIFLNFMSNLNKKIKEQNINRYVLVLDNLSSHKTKLLKDFYLNNRMNIIFNSPYMSKFNCVELFFRLIKRKIYQKIYKSTDEAAKEMIKVMNDPKLNEGLKQNFKETLEEYYKFSIDHMNINLNNFNYDKKD